MDTRRRTFSAGSAKSSEIKKRNGIEKIFENEFEQVDTLDKTSAERKRSESNHDQVEFPLFHSHQNTNTTIAIENSYCWCVDHDNERIVLDAAFSARGWSKINPNEDNWHVFWTTKEKRVNDLLSSSQLRNNQLVNHFPNYHRLSRKDLLVHYLRRSKETESNCVQHYDFIPETYILPEEEAALKTAFLANKGAIWIVKPCDASRGFGISLVQDIQHLPSNVFSQPTTKHTSVPSWGQTNHVVSKYIDNPLLVNNRKFDLRIYVLIKHFQPLEAYIYKDGFARFCSEEYSVDVASLGNPLIHLTNVSVQKLKSTVSKQLKQPLQTILHEIKKTNPASELWEDIKSVVSHTLMCFQSVIEHNSHSFELLGFDILVDANLKPWLVEVNTSPSIDATDEQDFGLKTKLIDDLLALVTKQHCGENAISTNFENLTVCQNHYEISSKCISMN